MDYEKKHIQKINEKNELLVINKKNGTIKLFLLIILIGTIFLVLPHFNNNLWFDEAYSIAISSKSLKDIWIISRQDVHPILYYVILHFILSFFNKNIIIAKMFSILPTIILGVLGYTHIRKDFGDRIGILFTFLSFFSPLILSYVGEIRMYTLGLLLVTLTFIYAYRILKNDVRTRNWILLTIFSILSSYTHYYALFSIFIINVSLIVYFIAKTIKTRNNIDVEKHYSCRNSAINSIIVSIIEFVCYIPWLFNAFNQAKQVSQGYLTYFPWIHDIIQTQITGDTEYLFTYNPLLSNLYKILFMMISLAIFGYIIYKVYINYKDKQFKQIWPAIYVYILVIILALIASLLLKQSIIYISYFVIITGLYNLTLSFLLTYEKNTKLIKAICICLVFVSVTLNVNLMIKNCSPVNDLPIRFVKSNYQYGDVILTDVDETGFIIMADFNSKNNIFYNKNNWQAEETFDAFGRTIKDLDEIKDYKGRVWLISSDDFSLLNEIQNHFEHVDIIAYEDFSTLYKNDRYSIYLVNIN